MRRRFYIQTMGCQMNVHDSDFLSQCLLHAGYVPAERPEEADVILANTCVVRAKPEQKAYSFLGRASAVKASDPSKFIGIVGCLAQMKGEQLLKRFPLLDLIMGPRELSRFPDVVKQMDRPHGKTVATRLDLAPPCHDPEQGCFQNGATGYISVMEGCNNFCSYCIVPYVRGREISRDPDQIMAEAIRLIDRGIKEITLLGQNVNSYVWKAPGRQRLNFPGLLRQVSQLKGLLRLRFVTSHPKDLSDELISCFAEIENLCPHIHLPFQAGSNRILQLMGRGYARKDYLRLIQKLRKIRPDIAITSDVMVGFPGETDQDFQDTLDLIRQVRFDSLFSFKYSDRKGTAADQMDGKVDELTKTSRLHDLQDVQQRITLEKNKGLEGQETVVLVEGRSKRGGQSTGRTGSHKVVNFPGDSWEIGSLVKVLIKRAFLNSLRGEPIASVSSAKQDLCSIEVT